MTRTTESRKTRRELRNARTALTTFLVTVGEHSMVRLARRPITLMLLFALTCVGCNANGRTAPSADEARGDADINRGVRLLEDGDVYLGQRVSETVAVGRPRHVYVVGRYTFVEFDDVPSLAGVSLVAIDGKLASATYWTCVIQKQYFSRLTREQERAAAEVYETQLMEKLAGT